MKSLNLKKNHIGPAVGELPWYKHTDRHPVTYNLLLLRTTQCIPCRYEKCLKVGMDTKLVKFQVKKTRLQDSESWDFVWIAAKYRQLSADIKKIYKNTLCCPKGPKAQANKTGINLMIYILIFVKSVTRCYAWFSSVWLRTGSNPADIIRFRSHTARNKYLF